MNKKTALSLACTAAVVTARVSGPGYLGDRGWEIVSEREAIPLWLIILHHYLDKPKLSVQKLCQVNKETIIVQDKQI